MLLCIDPFELPLLWTLVDRFVRRATQGLLLVTFRSIVTRTFFNIGDPYYTQYVGRGGDRESDSLKVIDATVERTEEMPQEWRDIPGSFFLLCNFQTIERRTMVKNISRVAEKDDRAQAHLPHPCDRGVKAIESVHELS
jgi:hypothetical protein